MIVEREEGYTGALVLALVAGTSPAIVLPGTAVVRATLLNVLAADAADHAFWSVAAGVGEHGPLEPIPEDLRCEAWRPVPK